MGEDRRHFLLLSTARSGSTLLMDLINNHPAVKCYSEPLNSETLAKSGLESPTKENLLMYLKDILNEECASKHVVGFKMLIEHLRDNGLEVSDVTELMCEPKVILLYRPNILETFVSLSIAKMNGVWYSTSKINSEAVEVNWEEFQRYSQNSRTLWYSIKSQVQRLVQEDGIMIVTYDNLCDDFNETTQELFSFLRVWKMESALRWYSIKQNPASLREKIKNYDKIENMIQEKQGELTLCL